MRLALLLDENVEKALGRKLERAGHDVEHVVDVQALGPGTPDSDVRRYACEHDRVVVTYDDHFADPDGASEHAGVFYVPDQHRETFEVFRIVQRVTEVYDRREQIPPVVFLSTNWL